MATPIRMCINCKIRANQSELLRLQCIDNKLVRYSNSGRSFYICLECIEKDKVNQAVNRVCKKRVEDIRKILKEILINAKSSHS